MAPRKLSMRKSNGSVVDNDADDDGEELPTCSGTLSRASTTASLSSLLTARHAQQDVTAMEAGQFWLKVLGGSLPKAISVKRAHGGTPKSDTPLAPRGSGESVVYFSPAELLLRRLAPYRRYVAHFRRTDRYHHESRPQDAPLASLERRSARIVRVEPDPRPDKHPLVGAVGAPVAEGEERAGETRLLSRLGSRLDGGHVGRLTHFNLTDGVPGDLVLELGDALPDKAVPVAKEAKLTLVPFPSQNFPSPDELTTACQLFFEPKRLIADGDLVEVPLEDGAVCFHVSVLSAFPQTNSTSDLRTFLVTPATTLYQLPSKRRLCPGNSFSPNKTFLPNSLKELVRRVEKLCQPLFFAPDRVEGGFPLTLVLSATPGSGANRVLDLLADELCVATVRLDCWDFWNIEGKPVDKLVMNTVEQVQTEAPCLLVVENVLALRTSHSTDLEAGNKTLDLLLRKIQQTQNECPCVVIFRCQHSELPDLPKPLTQRIHFEFAVPDLLEQDRCDFFRFWSQTTSCEMTETEFATMTRGFVLSELEQTVQVARRQCLLQSLTSVSSKSVQTAIEQRNRAFGDAVGAPKVPTVKWSDVGGLEDVKKAIAESLRLNLKAEGKANSLKRSGIVLYGPPGCGKTLIAKAVANEFNVTFLSVKGPELLNQYVGQSEQNLRAIFEKARLASPSIVFFDEMDSLAPNRGATGDAGGVMDRMVSQLLAELDSLHTRRNCNVFVMAATNRPDLLDPCLLTPGRFDKSIHVRPASDVDSKIRILEPVCRRMTLAAGVTPEIIAHKCPSLMSGADISSLMQKAAMEALRETILALEARSLHGDAERQAIEEATVTVRLEHIEHILAQFVASLDEKDLRHYRNLEEML